MFARVQSHRNYEECGNVSQMVSAILALNHGEFINLNGRRFNYRGQITNVKAAVDLALVIDCETGNRYFVNEYSQPMEEVLPGQYWADLRPAVD